MLIFYLSLIPSEENKAKFVMLYETFYSFMLYIATSIVKDKNHAEEVVHDVFLELIPILDKVRTNSLKETRVYLGEFVKHSAIDYVRKLNREIATDDDKVFTRDIDEMMSIETIVEEKDALNVATQLINELSPVPQTVYWLRAEGYSYAEIAQAVNKEEDTCRQIYLRTDKKLKALLRGISNEK